MINKIDIERFGLFQDYEWNSIIGNKEFFKKINIIYGRNYSGKTTLARIFKCIENGLLHPNYQNALFNIHLDTGDIVTNTNLDVFQKTIQVRVYNTDFIQENLSWLHNLDGTIRPFTILGTINVELDKKIKQIDVLLGSIEAKTGLLNDFELVTEKYASIKKQYDTSFIDLETRLRNKARDIKNAAGVYNQPTYQINSIKSDIPTALNVNILPEELVLEKLRLLKEEAKPAISKIDEFDPLFSSISEKTEKLLSKVLKPSKPIADLINDSLLQEWVRQGIEKHKGIRETCGFCGNPIPKDLWDKLDAHFSKESEDLRLDIIHQLELIELEVNKVKSIISLNREQFYSTYFDQLEYLNETWNQIVEEYIKELAKFKNELLKRSNDIFKQYVMPLHEDYTQSIITVIQEFNKLIENNNLKTSTLSNDQAIVRNELRINEIAKFVKSIDYSVRLSEIKKLEKEVNKVENEKNSKQTEINTYIEEKRSLEAQAKDESKGAELVNQHLTHFFGHDELKLVAEGQTPNMNFIITREGGEARNLSEGECSLISFCYFIARMEDEMKDELNNEKLIIYIDDPISSLDSNHIFFMYSLIDTIIVRPKKFGQLFISTHNLDFLKYLKRIAKSGKDIEHYIVERRQKCTDKRIFLYPMPEHIKNYVTEFNYLFNEIYKVCKETGTNRKRELENTYNQFYNLPNNLRKFLECYLFFKFPNKDNPLDNLGKLFDDNVPSLINRVINEYSHLTYIDRGWKPIDVDEAEDCARIVMDKIKEKDPSQYQALVESIS